MTTSRKTADAGLAPVVGSMLVVFISIVLAISVWIMIQKIRDDTGLGEGEAKPQLGFEVMASEPKVRVVLASPDIDWFEDLRISGTCSPTLNGAAFPTAPGTVVKPDDFLKCEMEEELIVSTAGADNTILFRHTF